jgi:membrane-bound lytic murein transglycosylase D
LLVPRNGQRNSDVSVHVADNGHLSLQPEVVLRRTTVRARKGENLAQLASRYGVSAVSAAGLNKLAVNARLKPGQRVALMLPQSTTREPSSAKARTEKTATSKKATRKTAASTKKSVKTASKATKQSKPKVTSKKSATKVAANAKTAKRP